MSRSRVAIVQARMGSTRLPGKVLADIGGATMLSRVVQRARRASLVDAVVVATTTRAADDPIADEAARLGVPVFRGDEHDVLDRYHRAAAAHDAAVIVRITADCPLIDPAVLDQVVQTLESSGADYASNTLRRTYPRGLDTEVMTAAALAQAWRDARSPHQREHVTPYLYENAGLFRLASVENDTDESGARWTVDTADDLRLVRELYGRVGNDDTVSWRRVLEVLDTAPELAALNRHVVQKELGRT